MAEWKNNNRACTTLWTSLYRMKQLNSSFDQSGDLKMDSLTFFNPLSSSTQRQAAAKIVADQLDTIFRLGRGAEFEQGVDISYALSEMVKILIDKDKQVKDLAETADAAYLFWKE